MNDSETDEFLRDAGARWRQSLPPVNEPGVAVLRPVEKSRVWPRALATAASAVAVLGISALVVISSGVLGRPGPSKDPGGAGAGFTATVGSAAPSVSSAATGQPQETDQGCFNVDRTTDPPLPTISNMSKQVQVVLVGTFVGFGTAFWDTPDGKRPADEAVFHGDAQLLTPVELQVSLAARGLASDGGAAVVWGGKLGCDEFRTSNAPQLREGQSYVFFLASIANPQKAADERPLLIDAWAVADNRVETPSEGLISVTEFVTLLATGGGPTPQPGSPEPDPSFP